MLLLHDFELINMNPNTSCNTTKITELLNFEYFNVVWINYEYFYFKQQIKKYNILVKVQYIHNVSFQVLGSRDLAIGLRSQIVINKKYIQYRNEVK